MPDTRSKSPLLRVHTFEENKEGSFLNRRLIHSHTFGALKNKNSFSGIKSFLSSLNWRTKAGEKVNSCCSRGGKPCEPPSMTPCVINESSKSGSFQRYRSCNNIVLKGFLSSTMTTWYFNTDYNIKPVNWILSLKGRFHPKCSQNMGFSLRCQRKALCRKICFLHEIQTPRGRGGYRDPTFRSLVPTPGCDLIDRLYCKLFLQG